jgi:hypothetical protein
MKTQKIHFINRIDYTNVGDVWSSPLLYYYYFFQQYNIIRHDINHIIWTEITKDDVIIIGGGGLFDTLEIWNNNINKLLATDAVVIGWGIGFNTHHDINSPNSSIDMSRFQLLGIRDYAHSSSLFWTPCVSGLHPDMNKNIETKRRIGIIDHKNCPISGINISKYERINNSYNIQSVTDFIASSDIIITNSYHITYWAQLMCKKVIVVNSFSSKFNFFKYKPVFYSGNINEDIEKALIYEHYHAEVIEINNEFFERAKQIIETKIESKGNSYERMFNETRIALLEDLTDEIANLRKNINKIRKYAKPLWFLLKKIK